MTKFGLEGKPRHYFFGTGLQRKCERKNGKIARRRAGERHAPSGRRRCCRQQHRRRRGTRPREKGQADGTVRFARRKAKRSCAPDLACTALHRTAALLILPASCLLSPASGSSQGGSRAEKQGTTVPGKAPPCNPMQPHATPCNPMPCMQTHAPCNPLHAAHCRISS